MFYLEKIQPEWLNFEIEKLKGATEADLRNKWTDLSDDLSKIVLKAVAIVAYADKNKIIVNWVPKSLLSSLRCIASGLINLDAWLRFNGTAIAKYLPYIPICEQKRLAGGGTVDLVTVSESSFDKRKVDPLDLDKHQILQVFSGTDGGIRSEKAQICYIESTRTYKSAHIPPENENGFFVTKNKVTFTKNMVMGMKELTHVLKLMGD